MQRYLLIILLSLKIINEQRGSVSLLLSLNHSTAAFQLSEEHFFFDGLMEAVEQEGNSRNLRSRLEEIIRIEGDLADEEGNTLATSCFLWLERHHRLADILDLGSFSKPNLETFLQVYYSLFYYSIRYFSDEIQLVMDVLFEAASIQ